MENKDSFSYTYSAPEQEEVKNIRSKYEPKEEKISKIERLRKLDRSVTDTAVAVSLIVGIVGVLVMGTGMSLVMVWGKTLTVPGIIIGIAGMLVAALAYPIYNAVIKKMRKKIAPEILRLTDELIEQ